MTKTLLKVDSLEHRNLLAMADMEDFGLAEPSENVNVCSDEILEKAALWDAHIQSILEPWEIIPAGTTLTLTDPVLLWLQQDGHLKTEFEWIFETFDINDEKVDEYDFWAKCDLKLLEPWTPPAENVDMGAEASTEGAEDAAMEEMFIDEIVAMEDTAASAEEVEDTATEEIQEEAVATEIEPEEATPLTSEEEVAA